MVKYRDLIASIYEGKVSGQKLPESFYQAVRNSEILESRGDPKAGRERARAIHIARQHGYDIDSLDEIPAHALKREHDIDSNTLKNVQRYPTAPKPNKPVVSDAYDSIDEAERQRSHRPEIQTENPLDYVYDKISERAAARDLNYITETVKTLLSISKTSERLLRDYSGDLKEARGKLEGIARDCGIISQKLSKGLQPNLEKMNAYILELQRRVEGVKRVQKEIRDDITGLAGNIKTIVVDPSGEKLFDQEQLERSLSEGIRNLRHVIEKELSTDRIDYQRLGHSCARYVITLLDALGYYKSSEGGTARRIGGEHQYKLIRELTRAVSLPAFKLPDLFKEDQIIQQLTEIQEVLSKAREGDKQQRLVIYQELGKKFEALQQTLTETKDGLLTEERLRTILQEEISIPEGITVEEVGQVVEGYVLGLQSHLNDLQKRIPEEYRDQFTILCNIVDEIRTSITEGLDALPKPEYFDEKFGELATKAEINSSVTELSEKLDKTAKTAEAAEIREAVKRAQSTLDNIKNDLGEKLSTKKAQELLADLQSTIEAILETDYEKIQKEGRTYLEDVYRRLDVINESIIRMDLTEVYSRLDKISTAVSSLEGLDKTVIETLRENLNEERIRGYLSSILEGRTELTAEDVRAAVTNLLDTVKREVLAGITDKTDYGRVERILDRVLETKIGSFRSVIEEEMRGKSVEINIKRVEEALKTYFSEIDSKLQYPTKEEIADAVSKRINLSGVEERLKTLEERKVPTAESIAAEVARLLSEIGGLDPETIGKAIDTSMAKHVGGVHTQIAGLRKHITRVRGSKSPRKSREKPESAPTRKADKYDTLPSLDAKSETKVLIRMLVNNKRIADDIIPASHDLVSFEEALLTDAGERKRVARKLIDELGVEHVKIDYEDSL